MLEPTIKPLDTTAKVVINNSDASKFQIKNLPKTSIVARTHFDDLLTRKECPETSAVYQEPGRVPLNNTRSAARGLRHVPARLKEDLKETQDHLFGGSSTTGSDAVLHQKVRRAEDNSTKHHHGLFTK